LRQYKYAGGDNGIIYRYFYNPVANKIVHYLPEKMAPNLITLIGFIFSMLPFFVLFCGYGTNFKNEDNNPIPKWFFIFYIFCYFMYRMLDELDGKQARRT